MVVGTFTQDCQVAVIGSGPAGYLAAIRLAQLGKDVLLIEDAPTLGGICLNEGCIPSKALIHAADYLEETSHIKRMGIHVSDVHLELPALIQWKDRIVKKLTDGVRFLVSKNGADVLHGRAFFQNDQQLLVQTAGEQLQVNFEQAVIATGSLTMDLPGIPRNGKTIISSREALSLQQIPEKLVVIGGGYVGLELGSVYRRFGSEVTIIEMEEQLLAHHDPEVSEVMIKRMKSLGIKLLLGHKAEKVIEDSQLFITVQDTAGTQKELVADILLLAPGRIPNIAGLGLDNAGIKTDDKGFVVVSNKMETNIPGIYAIGDVVGGPLLAHKAYREAKVAAEVIAGELAAFDNIVIPAVVYTDPELAWAGLSEKEARNQGFTVVTGSFPFRASGRAMTLNAPEGFVKTIADADSKRILGVYIVGKNASEMISEAALAIEMGAFLDDLSQTIHPHPTLSEGLLESVEAALGEAIHIINK